MQQFFKGLYYTTCQRLCSTLVKNVGSEPSLGSYKRADFPILLLFSPVTSAKLLYVSVSLFPQP